MFRITAAVREYFNYRYDRASLRLEEARLTGLRDPRPQDFRSPQQRAEDESYEARADSDARGSSGTGEQSMAGGSVK